MPLSSWNYKGVDPGLRMLGPTAQDFHAAFGLGKDDKTIASGNLTGVALAAIQGLHRVIRNADGEIAAQRQAIARLTERLSEMEARVAALAGTTVQAGSRR